MKRSILWGLILGTLWVGVGFAQQPESAVPSADLEKVLNRMDSLAAKFRSAKADFVWDQYQKVVDAVDTQKGKIYFRRTGKEIQMAAEIREYNGRPEPKYVLFAGNKVSVTQSNIINEYPVGKNKEALESFLVLGFGGSGQAMLKAFDVSYQGQERVGEEQTSKLNLVPKSENVRNNFPHITLWINDHGISVQQQLFSGQGDYRLAKYSDIDLNDKISDSVFKLKTNGKTQIQSH
ncbi:MAG: outer membrane lipoprotein carrier protein LolA [Acidobacteriota bacterium]|nr:outer membrane lipoprotein carrier protein LolA [Acidobacteriota bacterium]